MGLELPVWDVSAVGWVVATLGLVGASVLDRFLDDDGADDDGMTGDDDVFGGGGGGDAGLGGDGFGDFDGMDEWDDDFGDDDGGSDTDELTKRLDDLEAEVATLSSTVSTVRSENEEISEAVDDIEEDVRNLLDIYEMVTRGINPFVDESGGFDGVAGGDSSFGLFDDDEEEPDEELDDDVASADADGFFDEELVEPDDGGFGDLDDDSVDGFGDFDDLDDEPGDESDDGGSADAASETEPAGDGDDMNDDAKSFSELKEEYDAGEADWADEAGGETAADDDPFEGDGDSLDGFGDGSDDMAPLDDGFGEDGLDDAEPPDDRHADDAEPFNDRHADDAEPDGPVGGRGPVPGGDPADTVTDGFEYVGTEDLSERDRKPYLTVLPADYVGDLLVMEWLEFLVSESDVTDAVRAINYYERIEWIGPDAATRLREFLSGFGRVDRNLIDRPGTDELVREHHTRSLRYITQLNGTSSHTVLLDRWDDLVAGSLEGGSSLPAPGDRSRRHARVGRSNAAPHEAGNGRYARGSNDYGGRRDRTDEGRRNRDGHRNSDGTRGSASDSSRPMTDPDPHPDHGRSADGGWGDGR